MKIAAKSDLRTQFFDTLFEDREGYICIATSDPAAPKSRFNQSYFEWPRQSLQMERFILSVESRFNCYFCVNLLEKQSRVKANCLPTNFLWADLDAVDPSSIQPHPQVIVQSSPGRWQGFWLLGVELEPFIAEQYSKRLAYATGADKSGWDLTQLLRVPLTRNHKYKPTAPEISMMIMGSETRLSTLLFEAMPKVEDEVDPVVGERSLPPFNELPTSAQAMYKYGGKLGMNFVNTFNYEPDDGEDWSRLLWKLIHYCLEVGMSAEEAFIVAYDSKVNKYRRDKRPPAHLWREILKAQQGVTDLTVITGNFRPLMMPVLVDDNEPIHEDLFINRYSKWACEATDAVEQFHDLSAMILLSTIIANSVRLETSYGVMVPNLWGMILGDSTLSRKTTAMRMVTDLIASIDPELIIATDGTAEGLLTGLEARPNKTSLFYKDELSGFFESINRREYLAGMPETLTALYDVPAIYTRMLRKETIRLESPAFIFFGGGVREKVYEALTENYVLSGFLPRFLIVSGDTDLSRLRRTGPPTELGRVKRSGIVSEMADLYEYYATDVKTNIGGQAVMLPPRITAHLSNDAWERYGDYEMQLVESASASSIPELALPTFERMSRSLLKISCVLAASRQVPKDETILVDTKDVATAAHYIQEWGVHSIEAILNAGKHTSERRLERIVKAVEDNPGILRSTIMQHYHLGKREADEVLGTLEDRGQIRKEKRGNGAAYFGV